MAKLNQDVFTLTLGSPQIPSKALILSQKKKQLKFKQYRRRLKENGDLLLSMLPMTDGIPTVAELMDSPLAKYITLAANDCGYSDTAEKLIVNYVHPLFLKAHSAASKLDNPSWKEATQGKFADEYWKAMELEIATLEAKVIALAACMRELTPIMDMVQLLAAIICSKGDILSQRTVHQFSHSWNPISHQQHQQQQITVLFQSTVILFELELLLLL